MSRWRRLRVCLHLCSIFIHFRAWHRHCRPNEQCGNRHGGMCVYAGKETPMSRGMSTWKPDGSGWRARIGVLTHDDNTIPESEFWTMAPDGVSVHTARVPFRDLRTYADPPGPDNATELLARLSLQGIVYAFTAGSYLLGTTGEQALVARLEERSHGIPVLMPCVAAVAAFRALAVRRIALFHPPWYTDEWDQKGVAYFKSRGFEVIHARHFTPEIAVPHPILGTEVNAAELYDWVREHA